MKKIITIFFSYIFLTLGLNAAEEGKFRGGIEVGYSPFDIGAEDTAQAIANASGSSVAVTYDEGLFVGRVFADYGFTPNLGVEVGYFKTTSVDATYKIGANSASESYSASGLDISGVLSHESGFYGKLGMHSSNVSGAARVTIGSTSYTATGDADGTGTLFGAGYEKNNIRYAITRYNDLGGVSSYATLFSVGVAF